MTGVCLFLVCFACICIRAQIFNEGDYLREYPPFYPPDSEQDTGYVKYLKPEVVRQQSGTDMVLKCNATSCPYQKHKIIWEFKACQTDFKKVPCTTLYHSLSNGKNNTWDKVDGHLVKKKCPFGLELQNVSESYNGLYRCVNGGKMIKTYEVEVVDSLHRYGSQRPELDVIPSNVTIAQNMPVIIQCKVYSKQPPVIWWFKQSDRSDYDIEYSDKYYNRINTTDQIYAMPHELNIYLSKLNIYYAQEVDSGVYVCVALTGDGGDYKDAVVKVIRADNYLEPHTSFMLLFLIPLIFALIPVTIWLCYYRKKKKTGVKIAILNHHERHLLRPVMSENISVNGSTVV